MTQLAARLSALDPDFQSGAAYELAPSATLDELIDAMKVVAITPSAEDHLIDELVHRGLPVLSVVAQVLLADPLAPCAWRFGETLVQIYQREPSVRALIVKTLIDTVSRALDAGGGTAETASFFIQLADCATIDGPLPRAEAVARRLLEVADGEDEPNLLATGFAQRLLEPTGRRVGSTPKPPSKA